MFWLWKEGGNNVKKRARAVVVEKIYFAMSEKVCIFAI